MASARRYGSWVSATEDADAQEQDEEMADAQQRSAPKEEEQEQSMIREAAIGKGMQSVFLCMLQTCMLQTCMVVL